MPPNQSFPTDLLSSALSDPALPSNGDEVQEDLIRVAILGCGMMGQEHISYISGYPNLRIDYLCDPHEPSLEKSLQVLQEFSSTTTIMPQTFSDEDDLLEHVASIDLLVIASPNYMHTPSLQKWCHYESLTILVEKPVAVSHEQVAILQQLEPKARIWVAMEYRYIPAISKLLELIPSVVGDIQMITIRENRYPFLHKIDKWNRWSEQTGDTLVEKCCHFFDLFRLISHKEVVHNKIQSMVQRGLNYQDEDEQPLQPIIDSAYVIMPFEQEPPPSEETCCNNGKQKKTVHTIGCLELCMFAEGSRHQEEIIVTGTKGRLEAYLPENKVFSYQRPNTTQWSDRSEPPPTKSVVSREYNCSLEQNNNNKATNIPTHAGYHYSSTSVEWYNLLQAMKDSKIHNHQQQSWNPHVSLEDGIAAVQLGLEATRAIGNED